MNAKQNTILDPTGEARAVQDAVATLFGLGEIAQRTDQACRQWLADTETIQESRNLKAPVIAFVGQRNTGKSTLVRSLITSEKLKEEIPCGFSSTGKTRKLYWIGSEEPYQLNPHQEFFLSATKAEMSDLGMPYTLLDTPGSSDGNSEMSGLLKQAEDRADLFALVVHSDQLEVERVFTDIEPANGAVFLPLIRLSSKSTKDWIENKDSDTLLADIGDAIEKWRTHLPLSTFLNPVLIPDTDVGEDKEYEHLPSEPLREALREALSHKELNYTGRQKRIQARRLQWEKEMHTILFPFFHHAEESLKQLDLARGKFHEDLLNGLMERSLPLDIHLKWAVRHTLMERISPLLFPVTGLWKMISLTSGAWDRLAWAAGGSIFALLGVGRKTVANLRERSKEKNENLSDLASTLKHRILRKFHPLFRNVMEDTTPYTEQKEHRDPATIEMEVSGLEALCDLWVTREPATIKKHQISSWLLFPAVISCFLFFWWMVGGPFLHLYAEYLPAVYSSWSGNWTANTLQSYPYTGPGFWFTTFVLALFPTLIMGMMVVALTSSRLRIASIREELKEEIKKAIHSDELDLSIRTSGREWEALQCILTFRIVN